MYATKVISFINYGKTTMIHCNCICKTFQVWLKVIQAVPVHLLQQAVNWHAPTWFRLLIHPPNIPIDYNLLTYENSKGQV